MHFPKTKLFSVIFHLLIQKYEVDAQEKGQPALSDCWTPEYAKQMSPRTPTKQLINLVPRWSNKEHPQRWVWVNYNWKYRMVQVNGKEVPIEIKQHWLTYDNDAVLTIQPYDLTPGHYKVNATAKPKNQPDLPHFAGECHIIYEALKPIVIVSGGSSRLVPAHTDLTISAEDSSDPNTLKASSEGFQFYWTCKQKTPSQFCDKSPLSTTSKLTIPANFLVDGEKFEVTVNITTPKHNPQSYTNWATFTQTVEISIDAALLEVSCRKNCPPATDYSSTHSITFLTVECLKRCESIKDDDYEWTLEKYGSENFQFDYEKNTQFGRNNYRFIIVKDVLDPGIYTVSLGLKTTVPLKGGSSKSFEIPRLPTVKNCKINPSKGDTNTMFGASCSPEKDTERNLYEIYAKNKHDSTTILIGHEFYPEVKEFRFMLPPSKEFTYYVKITTLKRASKDYPVSATVNPLISNREEPGNWMKAVDKMYGDPSSNSTISKKLLAVNGTDRENALKKLRSLINDVVSSKFKSQDQDLIEFVENLKLRVIDDLLNTPFASINDVVEMSDSVSRLVNYNAPLESDPLMGKFTTTICKKMISKHIEMVKKEKFPLNLGEKTNRVSRALAECLESNTKPNFNAIKPEDLNITTEEPNFDVPIPTENYANYIDFSDEYYRNLEYLQESTYNIVNASVMSAKVLAMTTAIGEEFVESFGKKSATIVAKDMGKHLAKSRVRSQGVVLIPSQDFAEDEHSYDILVTTWTNDIMWWNPKKITVATDVVSIEFWHSTCKERVNYFVKPVKLFFNISEDKGIVTVFNEEQFNVPEGYTTMSKKDFNQLIKVRRVVVPKGVAVRVQFHNIQKTDALDVVTTLFKFPTIEDFASSTTITSGSDSTFTIFNREDYDIWGYVGVLANKEAVINNSHSLIEYDLGFVAAFCMRWIDSNSSWTVACEPGNEGNLSVIDCRCTNFSIIAGYVQNVASTLQEVWATELELQLQGTLVVFITLATTFGLYCLVLICGITIRKSDIYFLADNRSTDRFAYVVMVKTGGGRYSSTTSNVTIKLVGSEASSQPHVINYPDPQLRLLQKFNKDMFLLTTANFLGDLEKVDIWLDCKGLNPDWHCKDILVYDMQTQSEWYFKVKKRLTAVKNNVYLEVEALKSLPRKVATQVKLRIRFHMWYLWQSDDNFTYLKKLTVTFSTILTIYVIALVLHGAPTLQLSDGFDHHFYQLDLYVGFVAAVSAFGSLISHLAISCFFRFSKVQYSRDQNEEICSYKVTNFFWMVLIIWISTSISFLLVEGFWVPFNKSLIWLTSCSIGIGLSFFLYEPIFVIFLNFCYKRQQIGNKFNYIWKSIEAQRRILYKTFGGNLLRPYFEHLYQPMEATQVRKKKEITLRRRTVASELEDLVMFGFYVIILYIVILANKDKFIVRGKTVLENEMFGEHTKTLSFFDIQSVEGVYNFINETLIPSIQPRRWYGKYVSAEPAMMIDMVNKYIGVARLRQQRIKSNICSVASEMEFLNTSCRPELSLGFVETRSFGYSWGEYTTYLMFDRLRNIWEYSSAHKTGTFGTFGEFATYSGGGYIGYLGRTLYNSHANFRKLFQKLWIDRKTRGIFIEFLTYNANYNVFNSIKLLFEQSSTGYTFKTVEVNAARMLFVDMEVEKFTLLFAALFVVWVFMLFFKQSVGLVKKIRTFFKDTWFMIDCIIIFMSIVCATLFMLRVQMVGWYLKSLENVKHNEFVNYFYLFYLEEFLKIFGSTLICIATIRLWKFLRFGMMFRILERTIAIAATSLISLTVAYSVILIAFSTSIILLYGNYYKKTNNVVQMFRLLTTLLFKASELELRKFQHFKAATFYFTLYGLIAHVVFFLYITIIVMSYAEAKAEFSAEVEGYTIKHYVLEKLKYLQKFIRFRIYTLRGGKERENFVKAKPSKFVNCTSYSVPTSRMLKMQYVLKNCIRRLAKRDVKGPKIDVKYMLKACHQFLLKRESAEMEMFFKGRIKGKRIVLIDDKRVLKIAEVVELLLQKEKQETPTKEGTRKDVEKCVAVISNNQKTLKNCSLALKLMLYKMNNVELKLLQER